MTSELVTISAATRNGSWKPSAPCEVPDWRDRAINRALITQARDGNPVDTVVAAIRRHQPAAHSIICWLDRVQLQGFAQALAGGMRRRLTSRHTYHNDASVRLPYVDWFEVDWNGEVIEVAYPPAGAESAYTVILSRCESALEAFANAAVTHSRRPSGRSLRYSGVWASARDIDAEIEKVCWDDIVLPPVLRARLREAIDSFFAARESFRRMGFAWRRGVLLVGPPGTGKTMVCKAAAASIRDLPFLYVRDLHERQYRSAIKEIFSRARKLSPCILAFEDLDGFVAEQNRSEFLNELDGFKNNEGVLILASSNHPEKIDEALLKRPSRFDRVFHLGLPAMQERLEFCRRILARPELRASISDRIDLADLAERVAADTEGFTHAFLKEIFTSAALQLAQAGRAELGDGFAEAVLLQARELKQYMKLAKVPGRLGELKPVDDNVGVRRWSGDDE